MSRGSRRVWTMPGAGQRQSDQAQVLAIGELFVGDARRGGRMLAKRLAIARPQRREFGRSGLRQRRAPIGAFGKQTRHFLIEQWQFPRAEDVLGGSPIFAPPASSRSAACRR